MPRHGKKFKAARAAVEDRLHSVDEAIAAVRKTAYAKFDETVEVSVRLGVDPKHADQMVRGTVTLPHGTGKTKRVLVFAQGEKMKEAESAGADHVGGADLVKRIQEGWLEFEAVVATPDMMKDVGKLGKILGPRGLMPNPKTGTVTFELERAITEIKAGRVEFRVDKTGIVHTGVGKLSFDDAKLAGNIRVLMEAIVRAKPSAAKGRYVLTVYVASSMGPGVRVDPASFEAAAA